MTIVTPSKIQGVAPEHGCHDCKNAHVTSTVAECRANPPQPIVSPNSRGQLEVRRVWPPIQPGDFCLGGWKLKLHRPDGTGPG